MKKFCIALISVASIVFSCHLSFSQSTSSDSIDVILFADSSNFSIGTQLNSIVIIDDDELLGLSIDPNPYENVTVIKMSVSSTLQVNLELVDMMGNLISILFTGELTAGDHYLSYDGSNLNPGIYYLKLISSDKSVTQQMIRL